MVALLAPAPNSSLMAGLRARLNNCCAIVSNIQPMLATLSTNQWYPVNSRHHAYFCPPAPSTVGDMKLLFYIVALTRSPTFSAAIWHASITTPREFSTFCGAMWGGRPRPQPAPWPACPLGRPHSWGLASASCLHTLILRHAVLASLPLRRAPRCAAPGSPLPPRSTFDFPAAPPPLPPRLRVSASKSSSPSTRPAPHKTSVVPSGTRLHQPEHLRIVPPEHPLRACRPPPRQDPAYPSPSIFGSYPGNTAFHDALPMCRATSSPSTSRKAVF